MRVIARSPVLLAVVLSVAAPSAVFAAGTEWDTVQTSVKPPNPALERATPLVKAEQFAQALPLLLEAVAADPSSADAHNYLGFTQRKLGDLEASAAAYETALSLNPEHRGALEYQGELFLTQGKLAHAQANLARLSQLCLFGCEEYTDLKQAIAAYEAATPPATQ